MWLTLVLLGFLVVQSGAVLPSVKNTNDHQDLLINCLLGIAKNHVLSQHTTIIVIVFEAEKIEPNLDTLSDKTIKMLTEHTLPLIISDDLNYTHITYNSNLLMLIFFKNCELMLKNKIEMNMKYFYLVIIEDPYNRQCEELLRKADLALATYDITIIVYESLKKEFIFLSIIPDIDNLTCNIADNVKLVHINFCASGLLVHEGFRNIFPLKVLRNYKKCPFKVGIATLYPYSQINNKENLTNLDPIKEYNGSDFEMLKIITETINASLDLRYIFRNEENPYVHMEYLDYLLNGSLDACAGGLYRIYKDLVDYSGIYSRQAVIWVYYVERDIRSWQSLVKKINGLYYFLIFYLFYSVVWTIISIVDGETVSFTKTLLYSWGALVGATSLQDARSLRKKLLNIVYLIMSLHLSAYLCAQMYSYLTIQNPPQIYKTTDELCESGKTPFLEFAAKFFTDDKNYERYANTSKSCNSFWDCIDRVFENKGSTILLDSYLIPVQASTAVNDEAKLLGVHSDILFVYHEMIIKKNSPIVFKFKDIVERLFEAGICQKLYNEAIGITLVDKSEITNRNTISNSYSCTTGCEITLSQSAGLFYIWIFGCGISCCVFVVENCIGRKNK